MGKSFQNSEAKQGAPRLLRSLTLTHAVLYGLGVTIGAGIYVLVGVAAGRSGMHAPVAFLAAAALLSFSAASFAELGTRMPVAASEAAYVDAGFKWDRLTLTVGLLVVLTASISAATISVGSAGYLSVFITAPSPAIILAVVITMGAIACSAATWAVTTAGIMTIVEVGGLLLIIGAGFTEGPSLIARLPEAWPGASTTAWIGVAGTALVAVFAFIGFEHLVNVAEEIENPTRTLPKALFLTLALTCVFYVLVIWTSVIAVPPEELAKSSAPLALVFERLTGTPLITMSIIAVVATLNGVIVHMIMIGRVLYGLAERGHLPAALARINRHTSTPIIATVSGVAMIIGLALAAPLSVLADLTSRCTLVIFFLVNLALIRIKRHEIAPPDGIFVAPAWAPYAGLLSSAGLFAASLF